MICKVCGCKCLNSNICIECEIKNLNTKIELYSNYIKNLEKRKRILEKLLTLRKK